MRQPSLKRSDMAVPLPDTQQKPFYRRLLWMATIWAASVLALLAVAGLLRLVLGQ